MKAMMACGLAAAMAVGGCISVLGQEEGLKLLDPEATRRFLPDRVPMETDLIPVDSRNATALQFPNKSRVAFAALSTSGLSADMQKKYQYVFVSETRVKLDRWSLPAGMVGVSLEPAAPDAPTRTMIGRDFSGSEIDRVQLKLDPQGKEGSVSFVPKSATTFELRIGKYVVEGTAR
jgi:hypothetical protein